MLPLAVTLGEPGGIGLEITLMAWSRLGSASGPFAIVADPALVAARAQRCGLAVPLRVTTFESASAAFPHALPVVPLTETTADRPEVADEDGAASVVASIDTAVRAVRDGRAAAVVTNPIQKSSLYAAGFAHPGHTEYLGDLATRWWGVSAVPVMMLAAGPFRVVPVTVHVPLREVPRLVTRERIVAVGRIVADDLRRRFGVAAPRIAVAGLNPHAGEGGALGPEDDAIVRPAVADLVAAGIDAKGPLPADTMFHAPARSRYDAALAMYHDQALIPIKTVAFESAVNVTLGLPFVRTSPDHGTALDIAGTGRADPSSLIAALELAREISRR